MKKKLAIILSFLCIWSLLLGNTVMAKKAEVQDTAKQTGKVHTYFTMLSYKGDILYQKEYEDGSESICRFLSSTGTDKVIVTEKHGIMNMILSKDILYYTTIDSKAKFVTYSIDLLGKNKKKIVTGTIVYASEKYIVYQVETEEQLRVYSKELGTGTVKKIFETKAYMDFIKTINDTLYFYKYESNPNRIKLYSYKTKDKQMTLVTYDNCAKDEAGYIHMISDVIQKDGKIYYNYGCLQGTGMFWYGNVKSIDSAGKKAWVMKNTGQEELVNASGKLYISDSATGKNYVYNMKTGKKTSYSVTLKEKQFIDVLGSNTYLTDVSNAKTITVSRFSSGTDKKNMRKNFIKIPFTQKSKYSYIGTVKKVGSYYVTSIQTMDYNDPNYGWKGREVAIDWFVADKNGKVVGSIR